MFFGKHNSYLSILGKQMIVKRTAKRQESFDVDVPHTDCSLLQGDKSTRPTCLTRLESHENQSQVDELLFWSYSSILIDSAKNKLDLGFLVIERRTFLISNLAA